MQKNKFLNNGQVKQQEFVLFFASLIEEDKFYIPELTRCENNPTKPITIAILNKAIVYFFLIKLKIETITLRDKSTTVETMSLAKYI